jgi:hypothetical protein
MNKKHLLKLFAFGTIALTSVSDVLAQTQPRHENISGNIGGAKFEVVTPSSISGLKNITFADWGSRTSIMNMPVEKAYDTLGASVLLNGTGSYPSLIGKVALVYRGGGINFTDKAKKCLDAGAIAVIIVNNIPGDPIVMGDGGVSTALSIPVIMVTDVDGKAINDLVKSGTAVHVSIGTWGLNKTHDIGIVPSYVSKPHALAIPFSQFSPDNSSVINKNYAAAAVANYGNATAYNITLTDSVFFVPKGSSTRTFVAAQSGTLDSITVADSIKFVFGGSFVVPSPTGEGRFEHQYTVTSDETDENPLDNKYILNQYITKDLYSKSRYNEAKGEITSTMGIGPAKATGDGTIPTTAGSVLFNNKADAINYKSIQYTLSKKNADILNGSNLNSFLVKWTDGEVSPSSSPSTPVFKDSIPQMGELDIVAISARSFSSSDSSGHVYTDLFLNPADPSKDDFKPTLEANTFYLLVSDVPEDHYLGYDGEISYFTRGYAQFVENGEIPASGVFDHPEVNFFNSDFMTLKLGDTNSLLSYPFSATADFGNPFYVDSIFYDKNKRVNSNALITRPDKPVSIKEKITSAGTMNVYPNPASTTTVVDLRLDKLEEKVTLKVVNMMGQVVYRDEAANVKDVKFNIQLNSFAIGQYLVLVQTNSNKMVVDKLSVNKQ